jgi:hypothetical protein
MYELHFTLLSFRYSVELTAQGANRPPPTSTSCTSPTSRCWAPGTPRAHCAGRKAPPGPLPHVRAPLHAVELPVLRGAHGPGRRTPPRTSTSRTSPTSRCWAPGTPWSSRRRAPERSRPLLRLRASPHAVGLPALRGAHGIEPRGALADLYFVNESYELLELSFEQTRTMLESSWHCRLPRPLIWKRIKHSFALLEAGAIWIVRERVITYIAPEAEYTSQKPRALRRILGRRRQSALRRSASTS